MAKGSERSSSRKLKTDLRKAGLSDSAIQAAWPSWWTQDAEGSPSAQAELRFTLARNLGLSAPALLGDRVDFVWREEAKYKHLVHENEAHLSAMASFAVAVGNIILQGTPLASKPPIPLTAINLRRAILTSRPFVDLQGLLTTCWSLGVPVVHLRIFPLQLKGMHAMAVRSQSRHVILLGRNAQYPAPIAFDLAHELGHVVLGHLSNAAALIDADDPQISEEQDQDEIDADRFALMLLTGQETPDIRINITDYSARQLARAAIASGTARRVEPGTLALCAAKNTDAWPIAMSALKQIYSEAKPVWQEVNRLARSQLDWDLIGDNGSEYLENIMEISRA